MMADLIPDEAVEAAARAMCRYSEENWDAKDFGETANGNEPEEMRENWRALARAALIAAAPLMAKWRPIEEAPRDGTMILAASCRTGKCAVVGWDTADEESGPVWSNAGNKNSASTLVIHKQYFTHFMPLPPPPQEGEK